MATLVYDFRTVNENVVSRALASIEARIARHNAIVGRQLGTPVGRSASVGSSVAAARARGASADAAAKAEAKAAAQAEKYWRSAHQKSVDFRIRQEERAHRARLRQIAREESEQRRAAASLDRQRHSALVAQGRAAERHAMMASRARERLAGSVLGTAGRSVGGTFGTVARTAGLGLGLIGSFAAGSAIRTQMSEQARASQLANQAGRPEIKGELLREAQNVKGFTGMETLEGLGAFVDITGNLDAARKALPELAELALATSTNLDELNAAAGNAFIPLADKIKDPQERLKALLTTMRAIAGQGAVGAVEIKDLATEMAGLAAATNKFKGDPAELIKTVGAMAQAARQRGGAATAAEAITPVSRFVTDLASKGGGAFKRQGIDVFANKEQTLLKDPEEIIIDVLKKTGGALPKISQLFGVYAEKAVAGFSPLFSRDQAEAQLQLEGPNAVKGQARIDLQRRLKSGEFGEAAVRAEFKRLRSAELSPEQQRERAQSRLQDSDLQFKEAMKKFNAAIGSELLPVLTKLVPEFAKLIPSLTTAASLFAKLVESVVKDPVGSVFKLIAAKLVLDLASAGIGNAIRGALLRLVGGAGAGGAGGVGGAVGGAAGAGKFLGKPTAAGVLGAAGIGLAVGGLAAEAIYAGGVAKFEAGETNIKGAGQELEQIRGLSGSSSRQEFDAARDALDSLEQRRREASKTTFFDDVLGTFGASNKKVEQKSIDNMVIEAQQKIRDAQAEAARLNVQAAREAGEAFKSAVEGTKPPGPNRGNTPTGDPTRS